MLSTTLLVHLCFQCHYVKKIVNIFYAHKTQGLKKAVLSGGGGSWRPSLLQVAILDLRSTNHNLWISFSDSFQMNVFVTVCSLFIWPSYPTHPTERFVNGIFRFLKLPLDNNHNFINDWRHL